jgi:hypothetical protein
LKGGGMTMRDFDDAVYVLLDGDTDSFELFETEEDLEEYLEDNDYDEEMLENVRVFSLDEEYTVTFDKKYILEEV